MKEECRGTENRNKKEGGYRLLVSRQNIQSETSKKRDPNSTSVSRRKRNALKVYMLYPFRIESPKGRIQQAVPRQSYASAPKTKEKNLLTSS